MSEQGSIFVTRDGICERDSYRSMSNAKYTEPITRASRKTLMSMLETLPDALFLVDDSETIVYVNASAQTITGATQKAIPGLGMGLYIVAEIVKHHGGTMTVESEVGTGSTFQVMLPLKRHA
jgi:sensor histidine kinase regulating citrate/malate metabolism